MSRVIILRGAHQTPRWDKETVTLPIEELRKRILRFEIAGLLLRYDEAKLMTYRLDLLTKPLNTALILRLLSRGRCIFQDEEGNHQMIDLRSLGVMGLTALKALASKRGLLERVTQEVWRLSGDAKGDEKKRRNVDLAVSPVYLRSDLIFGLRSGGSVGHIAGVLNNLDRFTGPSVFLTTDRIPTVRDDIETHVIKPTGRFADFSELPGIHFNEIYGQESKKHLARRKVGFLYQRYSLNNYVGAKLSKELKIPFVLEYNGSEVWINRHWGRPLKYETLSRQIEMLNLKMADLVVVVSKAMNEELVAQGIEAKKILVNPNGVDPERYSPLVDGSLVREKYALLGKVVIGFIGTFGKWHGAEVLAEAFGLLLRQFPEYKDRVRLLMIGDGVMMPLVKEKIIQLEMAPHCILTGLIPQEEGPEHLAACDILVASHVPNPDGTPFFGSPTKLFEYMAMGKGIVASDLDQIGEVLMHDVSAWLVKPGDAASLMQGLKVLIDDGQKRERLGRAAREEVVAKYTWKEHTHKIIEKLKERCG